METSLLHYVCRSFVLHSTSFLLSQQSLLYRYSLPEQIDIINYPYDKFACH